MASRYYLLHILLFALFLVLCLAGIFFFRERHTGGTVWVVGGLLLLAGSLVAISFVLLVVVHLVNRRTPGVKP